MPDELYTTMPPPAAEPPPIDVRLSQLRAELNRVRELLTNSVLDVRADKVRIIMTPEVAREFFAVLDVGISLGGE